jgi:hypothetical protein
LKPEDRVLLKLSFVWYFRFAPDEIEYLARLNRCPVREVLRRLSELRRETAAQHSRAIEQEHVRIDPLQDLIAGELHLASLYRRQRNLEASHNIDLSLIGVIGDIQQELTGAEARLLKQFDPQGHEAILVRVTPVRIVPLLNERWTAAALQNRLDALARTLTTGPKGAT